MTKTSQLVPFSSSLFESILLMALDRAWAGSAPTLLLQLVRRSTHQGTVPKCHHGEMVGTVKRQDFVEALKETGGVPWKCPVGPQANHYGSSLPGLEEVVLLHPILYMKCWLLPEQISETRNLQVR